LIEFKDTKGNTVQFLYEPQSFSEKIEHILVICKYKHQWVLTAHKLRGWEFPGGKVEQNETLEEAAIREVWEETGALLKTLTPIAEYKVLGDDDIFIKKVFYGQVKVMEQKENYHETFGPVLVEEEDLLEHRSNSHYSFIMKDRTIELCIMKIEGKDRGSSV
jgi:8-oxo-dGTP diphosphatase